MTYKVQVTREGRWWMISVPEIDGLTQARRLAEVDQMAKELIAVTLDVRLSKVTVDVEFGAIDGVDVGPRLDTIKQQKETAAALEADVSAEVSALVKELVARNVPLRDIGKMLGVSFQRVHQIAA